MPPELQLPIDYRVSLMNIIVNPLNDFSGKVTLVVRDHNEMLWAIDPQDDRSLTKIMGITGAKIVGRGTLTEAVTRWKWFVSWRPYYPAPAIKE